MNDDQKAEFMRRHNAVHAEWSAAASGEVVLTKLVLAPLPPVPKPQAAEPKQPGTKGIAASLMKQHEIQFAHSRVRPPVKMPASEGDVPRAVSAKQGASRGSQAKVQKRAS